MKASRDAALIAKYQSEKYSMIDLENQFDLTSSGIYRILKKHNIDTKRVRLGKNAAAIKDAYLSGKSIANIAKYFKCSESLVFKKLKLHGIDPNRKKDISYNQAVFSENSPEVAYHAGFGYADGCLHKSKGKYWTYSLIIHSKDAIILKNFCDTIGADYDAITYLTTSSNCPAAKIVLSGNQLPETLARWGIVERKTDNFLEPAIPNHLLKHYLRGWIDGDGTVIKKGKQWAISVACNQEKALKWFQKSLSSIGYSGNSNIYRVGNHYRLTVGGRLQVQDLCKKLGVCQYFCLPRKLESLLGDV